MFTLTRFGDTSGSVTVDWATSDGTAQAGRDYVPAAGPLYFAPDEMQQQVAVAVHGDAETEAAEDFVISIVDVTGATVAQCRAWHDLNDTRDRTGSGLRAIIGRITTAACSSLAVRAMRPTALREPGPGPGIGVLRVRRR